MTEPALIRKAKNALGLSTRLGRLRFRLRRQFQSGGTSVIGVTDDAGGCLYQLVKESQPGNIVEIGSCFGLSTLYLATAAQAYERGTVWAVDPHMGEIDYQMHLPEGRSTYDIFLTNIRNFGVEEVVRPVRLTSSAAAAAWGQKPISLLFIDGLHTYEAVTEDITLWFPHVVAGGVIVFDDYHNPRCPGVKRAVDEQMTASRVQLPLQTTGGLAWTRKL